MFETDILTGLIIATMKYKFEIDGTVQNVTKHSSTRPQSLTNITGTIIQTLIETYDNSSLVFSGYLVPRRWIFSFKRYLRVFTNICGFLLFSLKCLWRILWRLWRIPWGLCKFCDFYELLILIKVILHQNIL